MTPLRPPSRPSDRPPFSVRLCVRLLETLLPEESRETVIGDVVENFERTGSRLQLWRETLAALPQLQFIPMGVTSFTPYTKESLVQSFLSDLRHAGRVLLRAPSFTVICAGTLAVGIAAATVIYSVASPTIIRSLPYPDADRLVVVQERQRDGTSSRVGYATIKDIRDRNNVLQYIAAVSSWSATFIGQFDAEQVSGSGVSWQYFRALGVRPAIGRDFEKEDDINTGPQRVIISHDLFMRRFGGDRGMIGKEIDVNGIQRTLIGVMPPGFEDVVEPGAQAWRVLRYEGQVEGPGFSACRTCRHLQFVARVKPGVSRDAAARELNAIALQLGQEYPNDYASPGVVVFGLQERISAAAKPVLVALLGAVALLLLIAIANVTNLQLARAVRRDEEFAVRAALGAGRGRIARQLFAEGLVLSAIGGTAGVLLAAIALPLTVSRLPASLPRLDAISLDWTVLAIVVAIVVTSALASGLTSAFNAVRRHLSEALRGAKTVGLAHHRLRGAIVVGEVALAMMLTAGAALLGRSVMRLLEENVGFDASNVVTMPVNSTGSRYADTGSTYAHHDAVRAAVRAIPGVESVGLATQLPFGGNFDAYGVVARDKPLANPSLAPYAQRYTVSWDYIPTMRIPIVRGRSFTEAEANDSANRVVVINEALAKRVWPGEDVIGKQIQMSGPTRPWWTVIGVAGNVRHGGLDEVSDPQIYVPERQWWGEETMLLVARVRGDRAKVAAAIREAVRAADPLQPVGTVSTMEQLVSRSMSQRRLGLLLFMAFGAIALLLACAGIYGVLAGSVSERTREFGVRTALGATPAEIATMVLRQGVGLAAFGLAIGVGSALLLSRYLRTLLYGVESSDPVSISVGALSIAIVAVLACVVPARRATRVDPMQALRE